MNRQIAAIAALVLIAPLPVTAQGKQDKTLEPNKLTVQAQRPPLQLDPQQAAILREALASENTEQKSPANFEPKVGETLPASLKVDVMPQSLVQRHHSLEPYGYAKLAKNILVLDPLNKKIIAVLPRLEPTTGKSPTPAEWAAMKGRPLTGKPPEPADSAQPPEPAGDAGDVKNGNAGKPAEQ